MKNGALLTLLFERLREGLGAALILKPFRAVCFLVAVVVFVDLLYAGFAARWVRGALDAFLLLILAALASGEAARRIALKGSALEAAREEPGRGRGDARGRRERWPIQARKIERDKALYAVSLVLSRRPVRSGSARQIWSEEIDAFEAYLSHRFEELSIPVPQDLRDKILKADREASGRRDYAESMALQFVTILEGGS
jgi:hypothetical protein